MKIKYHNSHDPISVLRGTAVIYYNEDVAEEKELIYRIAKHLAKGEHVPNGKTFETLYSKERPGMAVIEVDDAREYEMLIEEVLPAISNEIQNEKLVRERKEGDRLKGENRAGANVQENDTSDVETQDTFDEELDFENEDRRKHRLFVDMDGTLAEFKIVEYQEQLFEEGYFRNLKPHENVLEAVKLLVNEYEDTEVFIISSYLTESLYALDEKEQWLDEYIPEIDSKHRIFVPIGTDKSRMVEDFCENDCLLDDYTPNLLAWDPPGRSIKLLNNLNHTRGTWEADRIRFDRSGKELAEMLHDVVFGVNNYYDEKPKRAAEVREEVDRSAYWVKLTPKPEAPKF